ncbi:MAG: hypothetical protein ACE5KT_08475 [Methanosarcinales archaeon]
MKNNSKDLFDIVKKSKILKSYEEYDDLVDLGLIDYDARQNLGKWYMHKVGIGATFEKNIKLVELENGNKVWWAEIVDNEWEEKVADWIFDENGNTLLCYPDPKEFKRILIEIDRKHGFDEWHRPIKKHKIKNSVSETLKRITSKS